VLACSWNPTATSAVVVLSRERLVVVDRALNVLPTFSRGAWACSVRVCVPARVWVRVWVCAQGLASAPHSPPSHPPHSPRALMLPTTA
jgi:hypothetical protein